MIEKINLKIHSLSSKPREQLHKHSPPKKCPGATTGWLAGVVQEGKRWPGNPAPFLLGPGNKGCLPPAWSSWCQERAGSQNPEGREGRPSLTCHQKSPPTSSLILRGIHHRKTSPSSSFHLFPSARKQKRQNLNYKDKLHSAMTKQYEKANSTKDRK